MKLTSLALLAILAAPITDAAAQQTQCYSNSLGNTTCYTYNLPQPEILNKRGTGRLPDRRAPAVSIQQCYTDSFGNTTCYGN